MYKLWTIFRTKQPASSKQNFRLTVISAGVWAVAIRIFQQLVTLLRPLVLARLLAPDDFGVMGIAIMTRLMVERLGLGGGLHDAMIRRDDLTREHFAAAWTFEVARNMLFGGLLALSAEPIAGFFGAPAATPIIRITGLEMAVLSLMSMGMIFVRKELDFRKEFYFRLIPTIFGTGITVWLAFELGNVWALALGQLSQSVSMVLMSYLLAAYFLRPTWAPGKLKDMAGFAIWTSAGNFILFLTTQIDRFFVARILGPASLGIYVIAGRITNLISVELSSGVIRVGFPVFARLQNREDVRNKAFMQLVAISIYILVPIALYFAVWAPEMVEVILGTKWIEAAQVIRLLGGVAVIGSIAQIYTTVLRSIGKASISTISEAVKLATMIAFAYPFVSTYGLQGAAYTIAIGSGIALGILLWSSRSVLTVGATHLLKFTMIAASLCGGLVLAPVIRSVDSLNLFGVFSIGMLAFVAIFLGGSCAMFWLLHAGPIQVLYDIRSHRNKIANSHAI